MFKKIAFGTLFLLFGTAAAVAPLYAENIALGKKYTFSPAPNYSYCTESGDASDLTDGATTASYFWTQKGCVGWNGTRSAEVTLDLEKVEPISGIAFNSAAGTAGVNWPAIALILVSPDGKTWYSAGELMSLDLAQNGPRDNQKYNLRKIQADGLKTKGRFVKLFFLPRASSFIFLDELEIERGDASLLELPYPDEPVESAAAMTQKIHFDVQIRQRYANDKGALAALIEEKIASLAKNPNAELESELRALHDEIRQIEPDEAFLQKIDPAVFRTIFPFDPVHAKIFALQAKFWRLMRAAEQNASENKSENQSGEKAEGEILVRPTNFWDFAEPVGAVPAADKKAGNHLAMAQNERRGLAVTVYSLAKEPVELTVSLDGDLARFPSDAVFLEEIPWTDTAQGIPVAAAILPAMRTEKNVWRIKVLPGLPSQLRLAVDSAAIPPGLYGGSLNIKTADGQTAARSPMSAEIFPVRLPDERRLLLGGWDYTEGDGHYNVNAKNLENFIETLREYKINAPWAGASVLSGAKVDGGDGKPTTVELHPAAMDAWLSLWPDAKEYFIFLAAPRMLGPFRYDAPGFSEAAALWAKEWGEYFSARNIDPSRVSFLVEDEPGLSHVLVLTALIAWAKGIKAGEPRFKIWEDPVFTPPTKLPAELIDVCDTLCPNRPQWLQDRETFESVYRKACSGGASLQFYSCSGPVRLLDPYNYFRLQAWHAFAEGAEASFFWAMGDGSGASSWNEYLLTRHGFTPMFIDPNDSEIVPAKQLEAMRESSADFELLTMLQERTEEQRAAGGDVREAERILTDGVSSVLWAEGNNEIMWTTPKDRTAADRMREEILRALSKQLSK